MTEVSGDPKEDTKSNLWVTAMCGYIAKVKASMHHIVNFQVFTKIFMNIN